MSKQMKIVVLAGGNSTERDVSIVSGTQVCKALRSLSHRAVLCDVCFGVQPGSGETDGEFPEEYDVEAAAAWMREKTAQIGEVLTRRCFFGEGVLELCTEADCVFMALHGKNGEDGKIQAAFDLLGITYTGCGYLGSALAMDKELAKELFRENQVPTPEGFSLRSSQPPLDDKRIEELLPCVVKPSCGGSSVGVSIARSIEEYQDAIREGFRYEDVLLIEKYIEGREFSVGVVDGEVYPVIEIAPIKGFYDYINKYQAGSTIETCPADLPEGLTRKMQNIVLQAYRALRLEGYGRIDVLMDTKENIYCLEANTLPGMTPTSLLPQEAAALGIDFAQLCQKLIDVSGASGKQGNR